MYIYIYFLSFVSNICVSYTEETSFLPGRYIERYYIPLFCHVTVPVFIFFARTNAVDLENIFCSFKLVHHFPVTGHVSKTTCTYPICLHLKQLA